MVHRELQMTTTPTIDPFEPQGELDENARIGFIDLSQLSEHYVKSADALVKCSLDDHCLLDVHVYAICFLYRHGLELMLKDIVWKSHYLLTGEKRFAKSDWRELGRHRLNDLWTRGCPDTKSVLPGDWPLAPKAEKQVTQLLLQFERHDSDSYSFRYPFGKKNGRTLSDLNNVNIRVLRDCVAEVSVHLSILITCLDWCCENQHE